jgi:alkylation response protein AidB-like acyl-CoA dehydrogenase
MDYELTENQIKLKQDAALFCDREIAPNAKLLDDCPRESVGKIMRENLRKLAESGFLASGLGEEKLNLFDQYIVGEALSKACASTYLSARASAFLCGGILKLSGTSQQKARYLFPLLKGELIGALAYTEPDAGSDVAAVTTVAKREGDGWLLNGVKDMVTNATIADILLVLAYVDNSTAADRAMSLFIVEKGAKGLKADAPCEAMGMRGVPLASVTMNNCAASGVVGDELGSGYRQLNDILELGRVGIAALCVGIGASCMEKAVQYAKTRKAFGKPIGFFQEVGFKLADMFTYNDLGRLLALKAAWAYSVGDPEAAVIASCAKLLASEGTSQIADWAMQIFAGHGYIKGRDIERLYRDAKFGKICEGTSEIQRAIIAKNELDKFLQV